MSRPYWETWYHRLPARHRDAIAVEVIQRLVDLGTIKFWMDDYEDKFGNRIPDDDDAHEHLYWNDSEKKEIGEDW